MAKHIPGESKADRNYIEVRHGGHSKILVLKTANVFTGRYYYNLKKRRWLF